MQQAWEYLIRLVAPNDGAAEQTLDELGSGGWELVGIRRREAAFQDRNWDEFIFKRPKVS